MITTTLHAIRRAVIDAIENVRKARAEWEAAK